MTRRSRRLLITDPNPTSPALRIRASASSDTPCESIETMRDTCGDRKSTRLNSSHSQISYAVFCLKKKTKSHPLGALVLLDESTYIQTADPPSYHVQVSVHFAPVLTSRIAAYVRTSHWRHLVCRV